MSQITDVEAARRCARAIASDISLYNTEKVQEGIEQDTLFEILQDEIEEGREYYKNKVSAEIYDKYNFYDRAIVDVLIKNKAHVKSRIW